MDMLETGNYKQAAHANHKEGNMTAAEYKTEFSMWAIFASPLVVTTPILNCSTGTCAPSITPLQREILLNTEVIAINQDSTPAGRLLVDTDSSHSKALVYGRNMSDGSAAIAFYNPEDHDCDASVDFSLLGWPAGTTASVRDLWLHEDLDDATDRYPAEGSIHVEGHSTTVLRFTKQHKEGEFIV